MASYIRPRSDIREPVELLLIPGRQLTMYGRERGLFTSELFVKVGRVSASVLKREVFVRTLWLGRQV